MYIYQKKAINTTNLIVADSYLAGLWTLRIKLDLFDRQFTSSICIVAKVHTSEGSLAQQLSKPPVGWSARGWSYNHQTESDHQTLKQTSSIKSTFYSHRLGGLMSMTDKVGAVAGLGLGSMSLPLRGLLDGPGTSSMSGVKMLLPLLVLGDCSVGLKLTGERNPWTWVLRARGKVFLPAERGTSVKQRHLNGCSLGVSTNRHCNPEGRKECRIAEGMFLLSPTSQKLGCRTLWGQEKNNRK